MKRKYPKNVSIAENVIIRMRESFQPLRAPIAAKTINPGTAHTVSFKKARLRQNMTLKKSLIEKIVSNLQGSP
jgi:hypothetical protein